MSSHNICFRGEIRKILCGYPLLTVAMAEGRDDRRKYFIIKSPWKNLRGEIRKISISFDCKKVPQLYSIVHPYGTCVLTLFTRWLRMTVMSPLHRQNWKIFHDSHNAKAGVAYTAFKPTTVMQTNNLKMLCCSMLKGHGRYAFKKSNNTLP